MNIRPMLDTDLNFVLSTWLKSYYEEQKRNGSKGVIYPKDDVFFQGHQAKIKEILKTAECSIATAPDDDSQILGWACFEKGIVHYIYVKQVFRKLGVAKRLMPAQVNSYSHHTRYSRYLNNGLTYDPYTFWGGNE